MKHLTTLVAAVALLTACKQKPADFPYTQRENLFNSNWEFVKDIPTLPVVDLLGDGKVAWERVTLPHTAAIEPLVIKDRQWQGTCYYRKAFTPPTELKGKHVALRFEGAMHVADVYINGQHITTNYGGYLPFYVDVTSVLNYGERNTVLVRLNNEDNPQVPPGKPLDELDFNFFGGLYRNVWLMVKDKLHVSDPIGAQRVAGGGILVTYSNVSKEQATVNVVVDVNNDYPHGLGALVELEITDPKGSVVARGKTEQVLVQGNGHHAFSHTFNIEQPALWSPATPNLYRLSASVISDGKQVDAVAETIGIRTFRFTPTGFELNGEPLFLRGTNRHQEHPYIGYAISDNANYRDAYRIRSAGFNFVRLSHYPHSKSFVAACDELGLLVMNAIPGWQFFGDEVFWQRSIQDVRGMVRNYRNHPSIVLWEASLNESEMPLEFMQQAHNAVHEEYPGDDVYTCGWWEGVYDVYIPARQHGKPPHYWNHYDGGKPILIAEYGDWEYYAHNAGFNQTAFKDLTSEERNSRQLRGFGQRRLAQQALNFQEAHNSNRKGTPAGDANWLMFDYNRGYAPDIEASGIMDIFRLPKFTYYFYRSQARVGEAQVAGLNEPFIAIANHYNDPSFLEVKVYSNCQEVELLVNGVSLGRRKPDTDRYSTHLVQPPFTFNLKSFVPGELVARGYINGQEVASAVSRTPGNPAALRLWFEECGKPLVRDRNDLVFLYAAVVDSQGTIVHTSTQPVSYSVVGDARLIGMNPMEAEAGIATILLQAGPSGGTIRITATANGLVPGELVINIPE